MEFLNYSDIKQYRDHHISQVCRDSIQLNILHEEIQHQVLNVSLKRITEQYGPPPSTFSFFVMGSAGRLEQSVWSDQDHGIIYQNQKNEAKTYFLALGREISIGLNVVGYPYCAGNVMASNSLWCQSLVEWEQQVANWMNEASWETIRNLLIFIDGRSLFGERSYIKHLKEMVLQTVHQKKLLPKILSNTMYIKKGVSVLGQILVETHGPHSGAINCKEIAILPYVNAVRLLAFKERILETTTLERMELFPEKLFPDAGKEFYKQQFNKLLTYRLLFGNHSDYDTGHYLPINHLTKEQKKEVKDIIKHGTALFHFAKRLIEKDDSYGQK